MEKIQSAIAKARAARETLGPLGDEAVAGPRGAVTEATIETHVDNEAWNQLPMIEPSMRRLRAQRIVTLDRTSEASAFDKLRTRILQQMQANNWRRIAITSPGPSSGKSTVAMNLAFSLSRQARSRIILSEMDLRKPSMRKITRLKTERDFAEVILGNAPFADHALRVRSNFALGLLKGPVASSAELLQDPALGETLNAIEAEYEPTVMMFDMPPLQVSDDMMAFGDKVDCVLIIAAAEHTKMAELDICERELANVTNVLGIVLNMCRYEAPDASYKYYG